MYNALIVESVQERFFMKDDKYAEYRQKPGEDHSDFVQRILMQKEEINKIESQENEDSEKV